MKRILIILFIFLISSVYYATECNAYKPNSIKIEYTNIPHLDTAIYYLNIGTRESYNKNDGTAVNKFQKFTKSKLGTKAKMGDPWCASFVSYCIGIIDWFIDAIRSASSRAFIVKRSIPIEKVVRGEYKLKTGSSAIFKNGSTYTGHIGLVYYWDKASGQLIEGNAGNKVQLMNRSYQPRNYQRITHFTEFTYKDKNIENRVINYKQHLANSGNRNNVNTY